MTDLTLFREYEPHELGDDGYPHVWHTGLVPVEDESGEYIHEYETTITFRHAAGLPGALAGIGVKDIVRAQAGHRCLRCLHPYRSGCGEWEGRPFSPDDEYVLKLIDVAMQGNPPKKSILWSPCDEACGHGAPVRVHRGPGDPGPTSAESGWAYSWPAQDDQAGEVVQDPAVVGAGALVRGGYKVQAAWRILTVHHLNGRKHDLRWWNLAALCQRCHLVIQRKVVMEQVWPLEHTDWFKLYAAGWYAYAYRGQTLTRQQTRDRLDELLALERIA